MKTKLPFCRLVGMSALTPALSPRRGSGVCQSLILSQTVRPTQSLELSRKAGTILPLHGGEGRGEGGCHHHLLPGEIVRSRAGRVMGCGWGQPRSAKSRLLLPRLDGARELLFPGDNVR